METEKKSLATIFQSTIKSVFKQLCQTSISKKPSKPINCDFVKLKLIFFNLS